MKKILLFLALLVGLTATAAAQTQETDSLRTEAEAFRISEPAPVLETVPGVVPADVVIQELEAQVEELRQTLTHIENQRWTTRQERKELASLITGVIITALALTALVLIVFILSRSRYKRALKLYELERMRIERGLVLPGEPYRRGTSSLGLIKNLIVIAGIGELFLTFGLLLNLHYLRFSSLLVVVMLMAGLGYAMVTLVKEYIKRRDGEC